MERVDLIDDRIKEIIEARESKQELLEKFWVKLKKEGAPLIQEIQGDEDNSLVTLVYREKKPLKNVVLIPPVGMRKLENCKMNKVPDTDLWYISYKVENDISFSYQFSPDDPLNNDWERRWKNVQDDEFNNNKLNFTGKVSDKYRMVPYAVMKKSKRQVWIKEGLSAPKGSLESFSLYSNVLGEERNITLYKPALYEENKTYGLLMLNDGFEYINILNAQNVLDNLIHKKEIPPIIAVFIDATKDRGENLKCNDDYSKFLGEEVIEFIKTKCNISANSKDNVIGGYSLGGLAASYMGLKYSNIFGNVLSQSGSYWYERENDSSSKEVWLGQKFREAKKLDIKFFINVGKIEPKVSMINTNIEFSNILKELDYKVKFEEFGSGHDYLCWGETLAEGLIYLIGEDNK